MSDTPASTIPSPSDWLIGLQATRELAALVAPFNQSLNQFLTVDQDCIRLKQQAALLAQASREQAPVILITGQSGSGKELIAKALHNPPHKPFVAINTASLPDTLYQALLFGHTKGTFTGAYDDKPGAFEAASDGTLFLDEIGDMPLTQQASLLRVLESREFNRLGEYDRAPRPLNCRIVAATNRPIDTDPSNFRPDLFARLMTFHLVIPPLGTRTADIHLIGAHYGLPPEQIAQMIETRPVQLNQYGVRYIIAVAKRWQMFRELP